MQFHVNKAVVAIYYGYEILIKNRSGTPIPVRVNRPDRPNNQQDRGDLWPINIIGDEEDYIIDVTKLEFAFCSSDDMINQKPNFSVIYVPKDLIVTITPYGNYRTKPMYRMPS